ncbi:hypothetical protein D3C84_1078840 [compost metagenome]
MGLAALAAMAMGDGLDLGVDMIADGAAQAAAVIINGRQRRFVVVHPWSPVESRPRS